MKVNKHRRLGKIIQTLERWAPLESAEISHNLANIFDVDEGEIKRNVVNDLKFLRDEGEVVPLYFNKFGDLISSEIEPEEETFYRVKWQLRSQVGQHISGASQIAEYSSFIKSTEDIEQHLRIRQGLGRDNEEWHYFYFELNNELYHLGFPKGPIQKDRQGLKTILVLARTQAHYPQELDQDFKSLTGTYPNTSCIFLSFKEPFLSSFENAPPIFIGFKSDGSIQVSGTSNKNSLQFVEVPESKAKSLLTNLTIFRDKTQTTHWTELKKEPGISYREGSADNLTGPILLRLKESTGYLVH